MNSTWYLIPEATHLGSTVEEIGTPEGPRGVMSLMGIKVGRMVMGMIVYEDVGMGVGMMRYEGWKDR